MPEWHSSEWVCRSFLLTPRARIRKQVLVTDPISQSRFVRFLLAPESSYPLEFSEAAILELCDGETSFPQLIKALTQYFEEEPDGVASFLSQLMEKGLLTYKPTSGSLQLNYKEKIDAVWAEYTAPCPPRENDRPIPRGLLAELSYRCPLHCPYCSNPLELQSKDRELTTGEWERVIQEAATLGVLHVGFSGGEPLVRSDLAKLVAASHWADLYSNLITSGVGFTVQRASELKQSGLDSVQISFQDTLEESANKIAGAKAHSAKLQAIRTAKEFAFPLTLNIVLHHQNMDRIESIIEFAAVYGAERLELANVQFYGWALQNRNRLIPSRAQVEHTAAVARKAQETYRGQMEILYVAPDYFGDRPKPCMQGWGRQHITINPTGDVLPCPTANGIPGLNFKNIRNHSLKNIWEQSEAFVRFRGTSWMPEPCRSCDFRLVDFGGCRCQAAILTGDANATDPACSLSPYRKVLENYLAARESDTRGEKMPFIYRAPSLEPVSGS